MKSPNFYIAPLLAAAGFVCSGVAIAALPGAVVTTDQVRAELVAQAPDGVVAGKPLWLGLKIDHQPHWHTYWKNPGDSGLPTTLDWTLPPGFTAGEIAWPTPQQLPIGPLLNYGYEGRLLLPVAVTVPAGFQADALDVKLHAEWLVCKDVCIPQSGDFALRLPAHAATASDAALFAATQAALPREVAGVSASAAVADGALRVKAAGLPAAWRGRDLQFYVETPGVIQYQTGHAGRWDGADWSTRIPLDAQRSASPQVIPAVLAAPGEAAGIRVEVAVTTPWPAAASAAAALPALTATAPTPQTPPPTTAPATGLGLAIVLALLGGMLLNLMPCVFPVLSLKVLGFARHAEDRRALLVGGLAYTAGVVVSFVALAALLLGLRAGGEQLGWGFQLQSPVVVASLAALFTLIGLNLAGVFELGSVLPGSWLAARARHPVTDSLLTGVLAVAVASPCTAPFMGASLGAAVTLPAVQALTVFAAIGLGMALPYLAASAWPRLAALLPRPGIWMQHFKNLMAFPMFATVVWLVWVLGQQAGIDGAAALLLLLLALAFAAWALGAPALGTRARRGFGALALAGLIAALFWAGPLLKPEASAAVAADIQGQTWQPWSTARVAQAQAEGRPVFVDFTAAWCVTCQFNKRTTLADAGVRAAFDQRHVLLLRADWTRRDAAISAELTRLGRSGVPVYALYAPGHAEPKLLNEILSPDEVHQALDAIAPKT
ncbi:MAG: thioredoxin family protein [Burkholderiales bacterium]|nr:thioredoxin family protein [Burkholderiales bacterium]